MIELLSPAGDLKSAYVAINNGADAVYLGGKMFNARKGAENFDYVQLNDVCEYAHIFGKKVYLTVNTILDDGNFDELANLIDKAIDAHVDAYIIQDLGVLQYIKLNYVGLELHASTQMAIHNMEGCVVAKKLGFKRVVLSRETPLSEIKRIKENVDIELEYFIQGALCVSFSGNCYISACLKNESGNKGRCLQLCRLPYSAFYNGKLIKSGYLLSAKDINMSKRIKDLYEAGIVSFKIEGRARRIGYNAIVTSEYRKIIDNYESNPKSSEYLSQINTQNLKLAFNRGDFVEGYLNGNGGIIYDKIQGHKGICIGTVKKFIAGKKYNTVQIYSEKEINKGDCFKIIRNESEICTIAPMDICSNGRIYTITTTAKMNVNDSVFKIVDEKLEKSLMSNVIKKHVNMCLIARPDEPMKLIAECEGISVECIGEKPVYALNQPATVQSVCENLSRLNDTEFVMADFMAILNNVFIKKQDLNNLRKNMVKALKEKIIDLYNQKFDISKINPKREIVENSKKIANFSKNYANIIEFYKNLQNSSDYFQVKDYSQISCDKTLNMYNIMFKDDIELIKDKIKNSKFEIIVANNLSHFEILKECNFSGIIIAGALLNIANNFAIECITDLGADGIILSPEASDNVDLTNSVPMVRSNFKNFPLMTFVHCPIKNLFKNTCANCRWHNGIEYMLNGVKLKLDRVKIKNCYFNLYKC